MSAPATPFLHLDLLAAAQAQKHVTHNEALMRLDALTHLAVDLSFITAPPTAPVAGLRVLIGSNASGAFAGKDGQIAAYQDQAWVFHSPQHGWRAWSLGLEQLLVYHGQAWQPLLQEATKAEMLGIHASADAINRLSVNAEATLLNHDGQGHQLKINKEAPTATASLLYQTGFSGRAEMGLTGDDQFHIKMSADGATWIDALSITANGRLNSTSGTYGYWNGTAFTSPPAGLTIANKNAGGYDATLTCQMSDSTGTPLDAWVMGAAGVGPWTAGNYPSQAVNWYLASRNSSGSLTERLRVDASGHLTAGADNTTSLGTASRRWASIYAATGTIQTSDARQKTDIAHSALGLAFIQALRPASYRWIIGSYTPVIHEDGTQTFKEKIGTRTHYGLIAQEVQAALSSIGVTDFAGYIKTDLSDPSSAEGLRYDQFIAPLIKAVQELAASNTVLGARVAALESRVI